ncbi:hypothetical protein [Tissierella sp. Yu-01]|uniref:LiaF transmembrane domain-containing protein n=1 Tax=Tissierella sp. Yu-01 TaxID=3035694 RepID=UPI00240DC8A2|nr:hypothetical protein [Tissierella sp. Yu-01]WFA08744.1 hypothetical protein P3962_13605 [Tissierella sp. Yu-01]
MKTYRVGTITMAIILIALGTIIFISQISGVLAIDMIMKLWPLMLILLGLEILYFRYKSKDDEVVIKYDVFSIFLVMFILFTNLVLYTLSEIGMIERLREYI